MLVQRRGRGRAESRSLPAVQVISRLLLDDGCRRRIEDRCDELLLLRCAAPRRASAARCQQAAAQLS